MDLPCWLGLTSCGHHVADAANAAPEIAATALANATALVAGGVAILRDRRGFRIGGRAQNGGQRRRETCHRGHDLAMAYHCTAGDGRTYRRCSFCDLDRAKARKETRHAR